MRKIRDYCLFVYSLLFFWVYLPHFICLFLLNRGKRKLVNEDVAEQAKRIHIKLPLYLMLLFLLHNNSYFRQLFYHRIGPICSAVIGWYRPGDKYFVISKSTLIGGGVYLAHPFSTEINAKSIGSNFSCRHLTTIGNKRDGDNDNRPIIGNNVNIGVNVTIIGSVHIGNNVVIGAGSVVVKNVPDNCIIAGNPAKIIKYL